jgi:BTB/POZ domain-containing protein KCTD9
MKKSNYRLVLKVLGVSKTFVKELKRFVGNSELRHISLIFLAAIIGLPLIAWIFGFYNQEDWWLGLLGEAHGMLFDILVLGILLTYMSVRSSEKQQIERYNEEIEDFLGWDEKEAAYRITGNIKRINKLGKSPNNLRGAFLNNMKLDGVDLSAGNLNSASLVKADLRGADLRGANLNQANLSEANLEDANLIGADLSGAILTEVNLSGAQLEYANLSKSVLFKANLIEANLFRANLTGAVLIKADLYGAFLREANLTDANFAESNLSGYVYDKMMSYVKRRERKYKNKYPSLGDNMPHFPVHGPTILSGAKFKNTELFKADLRHTNLIHVSLDEAKVNGTRFTFSCLEGGAMMLPPSLKRQRVISLGDRGAIFEDSIVKRR